MVTTTKNVGLTLLVWGQATQRCAVRPLTANELQCLASKQGFNLQQWLQQKGGLDPIEFEQQRQWLQQVAFPWFQPDGYCGRAQSKEILPYLMLVSQCEYRQAIQDTALGPRGIQSAVDATRHQAVVLQFSRALAIELGGGPKLRSDPQWYTECLFQRVCRKLLTL